MKKDSFKILALGDIVSPGAVDALSERLWPFRKEHEIDCVIANGENACVGNGLDPQPRNEFSPQESMLLQPEIIYGRKKKCTNGLTKSIPCFAPPIIM